MNTSLKYSLKHSLKNRIDQILKGKLDNQQEIYDAIGSERYAKACFLLTQVEVNGPGQEYARYEAIQIVSQLEEMRNE